MRTDLMQLVAALTLAVSAGAGIYFFLEIRPRRAEARRIRKDRERVGQHLVSAAPVNGALRLGSSTTPAAAPSESGDK